MGEMVGLNYKLQKLRIMQELLLNTDSQYSKRFEKIEVVYKLIPFVIILTKYPIKCLSLLYTITGDNKLPINIPAGLAVEKSKA